MITIKQSFKWSPNGYTIETVNQGDHDHLPDRAIAIAGELGLLVESKPQKSSNKSNKKKAEK